MTLLGIDVGGTAVKIGLVSAQGELLRQSEHPVDHDGYETPILTSILTHTAAFLQTLEEEPVGIGVSATGQINAKEGLVAGTCGSLPGWIGVSLKASLENAFGLPTTAMNDANCAALGEQWVGRARGVQNVVMVTLGTGVGGGIISDGAILEGSHGFAGEIGHIPLHAGGQPCTCGNLGCYEQYASATALVRKARARDAAAVNGRWIFTQAAQDNAAMLAVLDEWIEDIASGLVGLVHMFNPQMLLIGGGVSAQEALLIAPLRQRVFARVMPRYRDDLQLEAAMLHNNAGILGAVRYWMMCQRA